MQPLAADDPRSIGSYRLLRRLGSGGMGRVYLGRSPGGRTVAVKVVHRHFASDDGFRARFRREVDSARRVGGRWTAPVLDADPDAAQPWVAGGYVAGPSLQEAVDEYGALPEAAVRALGAGLAEALAAVHQLGLVHRDVKPSNVLLALDGPRLIDFGIARATDGTTSLTSTGVALGSPGYMSPEQVLSRDIGAASDIFSLGAVLACASTGQGPFPGDSSASLLYKVVHEEPELPGLTGDLREVIADCLAKNPAERPSPALIAERLSDGGGAGSLLGSGWLPGPVLEEVGRRAVLLLDLELDPEPGVEPGPGPEPEAELELASDPGSVSGSVSGSAARASASGGARAESGSGSESASGSAGVPDPRPAAEALGQPGPQPQPSYPSPRQPGVPERAAGYWPTPPPSSGPIPFAVPSEAAPAATGTPPSGVPRPAAPAYPGFPAGVPAGSGDPRPRSGEVALQVGKRRLSCTLVLSVAGALAVATTAAVFAFQMLPGGGTSNGDAAPAPGASGSPTGKESPPPNDSEQPPAGAEVPKYFLGTWQGEVTTSQGGLPGGHLSVTITPGKPNEVVANFNYTVPGGLKCYGFGTLKSAKANKLVIEERADTGRSAGSLVCSENTADVTFTRQSDGTLKFVSTDDRAGRPVAELSRNAD